MAAAGGVEFNRIERGDPAPWFRQRSIGNPNYVFDSAAGRYILLCFHLSAADPRSRAALAAVEAHRALFDDETISFFGVTLREADEADGLIRQSLPGIRHFIDWDGSVSRLYGAVPAAGDLPGTGVPMRRMWLVLDPTLRVLKVFPFAEDRSEEAALFSFLAGLPPVAKAAGFEMQAPVLYIPDVFEPELCRHLIGLYEANGGAPSGFMREIGGKTVMVADPSHKTRRDYIIEDEKLIGALQARFKRRIVPMIARAHQFHCTRMERYIVACYAAEDNAHFRAHRDNTTKGTAHRRFAVSINLNSEFEGGEVSFPEYGPRSYKPAPAVRWCSPARSCMPSQW